MRRLILVFVVLLAAYSSGAAGSARATTPAELAVVDFVTLVARGDTHRALEQTCSAFGAHRNPSLWRTQVQDERRRLGPIRNVTARQVDDDRFSPLMPAHRSVRVLYAFTTKSGRHTGLAFQVNKTARGWILCGTSSTRQIAICDHDPIRAGPPTAADPEQILTIDPPARTALDENGALTTRDAERVGYTDGWTRSWRYPKFGGVRGNAYRYQTTQDALEFVRADWKRKCPDGTTTFPVDTASGVAGLRLRSLAWTGIQPIDEGPYNDEVWFIRGTTAVFFGVSPLKSTADHSVITEMTQRASAAAGPATTTTTTLSQ